MARHWLLIMILIVSACATNVPLAIRTAPPGAPLVSEVQSSSDQFVGTTVRWGGLIINVENQESFTWIELVSRRLSNKGKPIDDDSSVGRFIAKFDQFADPKIFAIGRLLTVVGNIEGHTTKPIGEFLYTFPIVTVTASHLWRPDPEPRRYEPPSYWIYDPWYPFLYPHRHPPYWYY